MGMTHLSNYYRELDIEKAVTKTSYTSVIVTYTREALASFPDRVVVMRLTASKPAVFLLPLFLQHRSPKAIYQNNACKRLNHFRNHPDHEGVKGR